MGFLKKLGDIARDGFNQMISRMEDPSKLAEQAVLDLAERKEQAKSLLIKVNASIKIAEAKLMGLVNDLPAISGRIENYLRSGDEDRAKNELQKKLDAEAEIAAFRSEIETNNQSKRTLERGLQVIDDEISMKKSQGAIEASKHHIDKEDAFSTFARMEEKIEAKEHEVSAMNELILLLEKKDAAEHTPAAVYDKHSDPDQLQKELDLIKKKLND